MSDDLDHRKLHVEWRRLCKFHAQMCQSFTFKTKQEAIAHAITTALLRS